MKINPLPIFLFACLLPAQVLNGQVAGSSPVAAFDEICTRNFPPDAPGAAVLVAKGDKILYKKAFGLDDLEKKTPLRPDMIFRLGSVTKQFTAVAILQLVQQRKISLKDDITKFIPDYPTQGKIITVEHLLNHTSGIKSYTSMPLWTPEVQQMDLTPKALVDFFKDQPMDFDPGDRYAYNNSGYILLGYIIEQVTGMSYADYLTKNVFKPAGLKHTFYETLPRPIPNWANGFQRDEQGKYAPAEPLSMTQPYAAGSLVSTVEDLYLWNRALFAGKIVSKGLLQQAHTPHVLPDGTNTRYGYGWQMGYILGSPTVEHGGSVHGFQTMMIYLPKEEICVAILTNCDAYSPDEPAEKLAALAAGHALDLEALPLSADVLKAYTGTFQNERGAKRIIKIVDGNLVSQRIGGGTFNLIPVAKDKFRFDGSLTEATFLRDGAGEVTGISLDSRAFVDEHWSRAGDIVLIPPPVEIQLAKEQLTRLVGTYSLAPGFAIAVTQEDTRLYAQATGQQRFEVFAKSELRFFLKVVEAEIEFVPNEKGEIDKLILHQGGRSSPGERMK